MQGAATWHSPDVLSRERVRSVLSLPSSHRSGQGQHLAGDLYMWDACVSIFKGHKYFKKLHTICSSLGHFLSVLTLCAVRGSLTNVMTSDPLPARICCQLCRHDAWYTKDMSPRLVPTHCSGLRIMCTEEADDPGPTADIQNHFVFEGRPVLQDHVVIFSCSWLVCQHLQVKFLQEKHSESHCL